MNRQEYIEYLSEELNAAEEVANNLINDLGLKAGSESYPITSIIDTIKGYLKYLSDNSLYDDNVFAVAPNGIEVYAIEKSLTDFRFLFSGKSPNMSVFWAFSTGLLRASLAVHLRDKAVVKVTRYEETIVKQFFTFEERNSDDIRGGAFDFMEFKCPETGALFRFFSYDQPNEFFLKNELKAMEQ